MIDTQKAASLKSGVGKVLRCVHPRQCPPSQPRASLGSLVSPLPASPSSPCPQTPTDVMSVKRERFPIFEFYVNEMIEHVLVSALFLRLNIIILRFIYDVVWLNGWITILFIHLPAEKHLGCFQLTNKASRSSCKTFYGHPHGNLHMHICFRFFGG